jgi:hypothetical protein
MRYIFSAIVCCFAVTGPVNAAGGNADSERTTMCLIKGEPNSPYEVIKFFRVGRGSYGSVESVLPSFIRMGKSLGADAIMSYSGSQRFGFFPWRIVRPVMQGVAVKWDQNSDANCIASGGEVFLLTAGRSITNITSSITDESIGKEDVKESSSRYFKLLELDELRKKGILTEAEFAAEKKKILSED